MALAQDDFSKGLQTLTDTWNKLDERTQWENVAILRQYGKTFLRITKSLGVQPHEAEAGESQHDGDEDDEEAIKLPAAPAKVVYDIVYSPSYQVPVLFLTLKDFSSGARASADDIYDLLVPESRKSEVQAVGVMGALSMTEHPVTGVPVYFVHPCRTQEAMGPLIEEKGPEEYLMLWLGVVGGSVGLDVPVPLAMELEKSQNRN